MERFFAWHCLQMIVVRLLSPQLVQGWATLPSGFGTAPGRWSIQHAPGPSLQSSSMTVIFVVLPYTTRSEAWSLVSNGKFLRPTNDEQFARVYIRSIASAIWRHAADRNSQPRKRYQK